MITEYQFSFRVDNLKFLLVELDIAIFTPFELICLMVFAMIF